MKHYQCKTKDKGCGFIAFDGVTCLKGGHRCNRIQVKVTPANKASIK